MIDPGPQLAIDEQLLTQQGDQIGQAPPEAGAELEIFEQKQGNERGPYLNLQGVGAGADKGFDAQVLFEGLEKQLDLPAAFVDLGDGPAVFGFKRKRFIADIFFFLQLYKSELAFEDSHRYR